MTTEPRKEHQAAVKIEPDGIQSRLARRVRHRRLPPSRISYCAQYLNRGDRCGNQRVIQGMQAWTWPSRPRASAPKPCVKPTSMWGTGSVRKMSLSSHPLTANRPHSYSRPPPNLHPRRSASPRYSSGGDCIVTDGGRMTDMAADVVSGIISPSNRHTDHGAREKSTCFRNRSSQRLSRKPPSVLAVGTFARRSAGREPLHAAKLLM